MQYPLGLLFPVLPETVEPAGQKNQRECSVTYESSYINSRMQEFYIRRRIFLFSISCIISQFVTVCVCVCVCVCARARTHKHSQLCLSLCCSMDCSPPGSSVHGIFQARIPELVAMPSSKRIFPAQRAQIFLNLHLLCLLHWPVDSLPLCHQLTSS